MTRRRTIGLVLVAALSGCGGDRAPASAKRLPPDVATPPASPGLVRISRTVGSAQLLNASTLTPRQWLVQGGIPPISRILGLSGADDQTVYAADNNGRPVAIDLAARRARVIATSARQLFAAPDGAIFGIDSAHHPVRITIRRLITYHAAVDHDATVLRGPGEQVVVANNRPGTLQAFTATSESHHAAIPHGHLATTWSGDLVTITTDSGVTFVDPLGKSPSRFVRISGTPTVSAFSPSGHRLYVARKTGGLVIVDRFLVMVDRNRRSQVHELKVPGNADALRVDRTGRWLLEHVPVGDSVRVVDLTAPAVTAVEHAPWDADLPQVVDGKTIVFRHKADLQAVDLSATPPTVRATLAGGAADLYIMLPWAPRVAGQPVQTVATAPPPAATTDSSVPPAAAARAAEPAAAPAPTTAAGKGAASDTAAKIYVQVSSSQNNDWAQAFARQLKDGGFPARVMDPKSADEGYRVVIGPYRTREEADAVGKRLGRSYFIITPGSGDT
ncbi:MAG TPA: SPOR domain-containing protein [Gemmatimonadales bacterium]|jgi:cell division septation protein DedD